MNEFTPMEAIRALTGIITVDSAVDRLAAVNLLVRYIEGDAEEDFVIKIMEKWGIKLIKKTLH
jgi:hypothetical protein